MNMNQFVSTGEIGLPAPQPTSHSIAISRNITVRQIRGWIEAKNIIYVMPDMDTVRCVFTDKPIGEMSFAFVRCGRRDNRIVLCLASCKLDSRYEVVTPENSKAVTTFKMAIHNMATIDRSLFSLQSPVVHKTFSRRKGKREETNRRSSHQLAMT